MADGYRLDQATIISRVKDITTRYVSVGDYESFYRESWNFLFEIHIDLKTATLLKDQKRIELYNKTVLGLTDLVMSIIAEKSKLDINREFGTDKDD